MQFTPQQLSGGPKFSSSTRIGNWQEEVALEEAKLSDFRKRSNKGNLAIRVLENKMAVCSQKVTPTFSEDGTIKFGDVIMLQHDISSHFLACDPFEDFLPNADKFFVSACSDSTPVARSAFRVVRPPAHLQNIDSDPNDDTLRVGQAFGLMCHDALLLNPDSNLMAPPLYLCSTKKNERTATKTTNRQLIFMSPNNDAECVWILATPSQGRNNQADRYLAIGKPANSFEPYLITHRQTNCCLVCDIKTRDHSDFGVELECYADRANQFGKLSLVVSEFKGVSTPYTLTKPDAEHYFWHIVTSSSGSNGNDNGSVSTISRGNLGNTSSYIQPPSDEDLVAELQSLIRGKGIDAFWNLRAFFFAGDNEFDGKIDRGDLKDGLVTWGITMNQRYLNRIIDIVDTTKTNGVIDFPRFMRLLRGEIPVFREQLIMETWNRLDVNGTGSVPLQDIKPLFCSDEHPLATLGSASHETVWKQFCLLCRNKGHKVTQNVNIKPKPPSLIKGEFVKYYEDLSAGLSSAQGEDEETNAYFERVIYSNWREA